MRLVGCLVAKIEKGKNILKRKGKSVELPSKTTYQLLKNDIIRIETPSGSGDGNVNERSENLIRKDREEGRVIT